MHYKTKYNHMSCKTHAECEAKALIARHRDPVLDYGCPIMNDSVTESVHWQPASEEDEDARTVKKTTAATVPKVNVRFDKL